MAYVYVGRDAFRMAALLIAYGGNAMCERIALAQVKRLALRVTPASAPALMFWAGVLSRAGTKLAEGEAHLLLKSMTDEEAFGIMRLEVRSRPQALLPAARRAI